MSPGDVFGDINSIGSFYINSCISSKYRLFSKGLVHGFLVKNDQNLKSAYFTYP